jgi:divalent metal cation (Fe/Co/Zn/Cd) transporter
MKTFLFLAAVLLAGLSLFVGIGVVIGFVLHWLLPAIDFGVGVLIGVVALAFTCQTVTRLMSVPLEVEEEGEEVIEPKDVVYLVEGMSGRRKRKRKSKR